ncbi:MAG TPA: tetratricopeptide repeat protein [Treponema sp.]|nr:tetratricopeptide repeat protein [Treponema sp.]
MMNKYNRNKYLFSTIFVAFAITSLAFTACSSAPKRPAEIRTKRNAAIEQLELANHAVLEREEDVAHLFLSEAWRLAVSTDDPDTRTRILLAIGNAWYSAGQSSRAIDYWKQALDEAKKANLTMLTAASRIHIARGNLAEGQHVPDMPASERVARAKESRSIALEAQPFLTKNLLYSAFAWRVLGLSEKELGNTEKALNALSKAIDSHTSKQYLEDAAYDWYLTGSVYSKAERYDEALNALEKALAFDRRAENSAGLGQTWMAIGHVHNKAGNIAEARNAWTRSRDIFNATFLMRLAQDAELLITGLEASPQS